MVKAFFVYKYFRLIIDINTIFKILVITVVAFLTGVIFFEFIVFEKPFFTFFINLILIHLFILALLFLTKDPISIGIKKIFKEKLIEGILKHKNGECA
jgi:hypothetical protein